MNTPIRSRQNNALITQKRKYLRDETRILVISEGYKTIIVFSITNIMNYKIWEILYKFLFKTNLV